MTSAISLFTFICQAITFNKAGEEWWALLIPFYGTYVKCKIGNKKHLFVPMLIVSLISCAISLFFCFVLLSRFDEFSRSIDASNTPVSFLIEIFASYMLCLACLVVCGLVNTVFNCMVSVGIAHQFKQSTAFGVGLTFIAPVFYAIIAFSSSIKYNNSLHWGW